MQIKELRKKQNISQKRLAQDLNIPISTLNGYENENYLPTANTLIKIADYLHVTIDELVGRKQENIIDKGLLNDVELDIIDKLRKLDKDNQIRLQAYAQGLFDNQQQEMETIKRIKGEK